MFQKLIQNFKKILEKNNLERISSKVIFQQRNQSYSSNRIFNKRKKKLIHFVIEIDEKRMNDILKRRKMMIRKDRHQMIPSAAYSFQLRQNVQIDTHARHTKWSCLFSSNSEACTLELQENVQEMFPWLERTRFTSSELQNHSLINWLKSVTFNGVSTILIYRHIV